MFREIKLRRKWGDGVILHSDKREMATITPVLTEEIFIEALRNFFREKPFIFFGTGMSCAIDDKFGMTALQDELNLRIQKFKLTATQNKEWQLTISSLNAGNDFEKAMNSITDQGLIKKITTITAKFIAKLDNYYAYEIAAGRQQWPAMSVVKKIYDTLPEGDPILHILTPNYDMLFEYACDFTGLTYTDGFFGGVEQHKNWIGAKQALLERQQSIKGTKRTFNYKPKKYICYYKVHGSLNYFFHQSHVIRNDSWMWTPPNYAERIMITPGLSKYQKLQEYRQEFLRPVDDAVEKATHFLFLGYGFNDNHLDTYIKRKLIEQSCQGLIITKKSNERIETLLAEAENLWIICSSCDGGGSRIYNKKYSDWLTLSNKCIWNVKEFNTYIFGG